MGSDENVKYWYNTKTGAVEVGLKSLALNRLGPFETEEEAARALQIIRQRAEQIQKEDESDWSDH